MFRFSSVLGRFHSQKCFKPLINARGIAKQVHNASYSNLKFFCLGGCAAALASGALFYQNQKVNASTIEPPQTTNNWHIYSGPHPEELEAAEIKYNQFYNSLFIEFSQETQVKY